MTDEPLSSGSGTPDDPWQLKSPPLSSSYTIHCDERDGKAVLVCTVGKTVLLYDARAIDDLHALLVAHGDWIELGSADEQKPAKEGTVEAWGRAADNPVGGLFVGLFFVYVAELFVSFGPVQPALGRFGERLLGFFHLTVGCWLIYLMWAVVLNFTIKWTLPV